MGQIRNNYEKKRRRKNEQRKKILKLTLIISVCFETHKWLHSHHIDGECLDNRLFGVDSVVSACSIAISDASETMENRWTFKFVFIYVRRLPAPWGEQWNKKVVTNFVLFTMIVGRTGNSKERYPWVWYLRVYSRTHVFIVIILSDINYLCDIFTSAKITISKMFGFWMADSWIISVIGSSVNRS